jgi:hypothetical protein
VPVFALSGLTRRIGFIVGADNAKAGSSYSVAPTYPSADNAKRGSRYSVAPTICFADNAKAGSSYELFQSIHLGV